MLRSPIRACVFSLLAAGTVALSSGCAVVKATQAPNKKDLSVLEPGQPKSLVIRELGPPYKSTEIPSGTKDLYSFKQGYSLPTKMARAVVHGGLDMFSLGLWELAGTPLESSFQGEDVRAEVLFDPSDRVQRVEYFEGGHLHEGGPTLARFMRRKSVERQLVIGEAPSESADEGGVQQASATVESTE